MACPALRTKWGLFFLLMEKLKLGSRGRNTNRYHTSGYECITKHEMKKKHIYGGVQSDWQTANVGGTCLLPD